MSGQTIKAIRRNNKKERRQQITKAIRRDNKRQTSTDY